MAEINELLNISCYRHPIYVGWNHLDMKIFGNIVRFVSWNFYSVEWRRMKRNNSLFCWTRKFWFRQYWFCRSYYLVVFIIIKKNENLSIKPTIFDGNWHCATTTIINIQCTKLEMHDYLWRWCHFMCLLLFLSGRHIHNTHILCFYALHNDHQLFDFHIYGLDNAEFLWIHRECGGYHTRQWVKLNIINIKFLHIYENQLFILQNWSFRKPRPFTSKPID